MSVLGGVRCGYEITYEIYEIYNPNLVSCMDNPGLCSTLGPSSVVRIPEQGYHIHRISWDVPRSEHWSIPILKILKWNWKKNQTSELPIFWGANQSICYHSELLSFIFLSFLCFFWSTGLKLEFFFKSPPVRNRWAKSLSCLHTSLPSPCLFATTTSWIGASQATFLKKKHKKW